MTQTTQPHNCHNPSNCGYCNGLGSASGIGVDMNTGLPMKHTQPQLDDEKRLKERILTDCNSWSVGYMERQLDKLLHLQSERIRREKRERIDELQELLDYSDDEIQLTISSEGNVYWGKYNALEEDNFADGRVLILKHDQGSLTEIIEKIIKSLKEQGSALNQSQ